jgi:hypothetical protein
LKESIIPLDSLKLCEGLRFNNTATETICVPTVKQIENTSVQTSTSVVVQEGTATQHHNFKRGVNVTVDDDKGIHGGRFWPKRCGSPRDFAEIANFFAPP